MPHKAMQDELVMKCLRYKVSKYRQNRQNGATLIFLVSILALVLTAYALHSLTGNEYKVERELVTAKALAEAKAALLGWSVLQNTPGRLPCPEDIALIGLATEGQALSSCTSPNPVIGRLPWRTLGIGDIRDGNGDKLWYVISTGFRTSPINSNTLAQLTLDGIPNSAVAIIFSAGVPLLAQSRPTSMAPPAAVIHYLEGSNNDGNNTFVSNGIAGFYNDRLIPVRHSELFSLVTKRILRELRGDNAQGLVKFYLDPMNSIYPYADADADGIADSPVLLGTPSYEAGTNSLFFNTGTKATLLSNGWFPLTTYMVSATQQQVTLTLNGKTLVVTP